MVRKSLGHYKIIRQVGSGGMGEVYAAEDTKLNRRVALKVLPEDMASQPERVARFEREAKAVAALDHPNIVTIHSVEEDDGVHFITMQLVEGETLSEKIPKKGLSLEKFFDLAIPMADAISTAHDHGITHRDLKPANVMVTTDGRVKILDFGLAKLREEAAAEGPTVLPEDPLTEEGKIVGTVAYMSPEQAEGKPVDHRSDIFSLGIILYEMATGERPFKGDTKLSVMSSIVKDTPTSVTELNTAMPRHLGRIVRRSLAKDVTKRYQTATDIRNELEELKSEIDSGDMIAPVQQVSGRRWVWPAVSGALIVALLLIAVMPEFVLGGGGGSVVMSIQQLTDRAGNQNGSSLSPDGTEILYHDNTSGNQDIYLQRGGETINLTENSLASDTSATFSPHGTRIAFRSTRNGGGIFVMGNFGGLPTPIVEGGFDPSWSPSGERIVYATHNGSTYSGNPQVTGLGRIRIVDVDTREDLTLYEDPEIDAFHPSWSPSGDRIAFAGRIRGQRDIWSISPSGAEPVRVTDDVHTDWGPFWSPDGNYLYFLSDRGDEGKPDLWRIAINENSGKTEGEPEEVYSFGNGRIMQASISGDKIVCSVELANSRISKINFNPETGTVIDREQIHFTSNYDLGYLSVSPNDDWLAFTTRRGVEDVFVIRSDGSSRDPRNLTGDRDRDRYSTWYPSSPDEDLWLTLGSNRGGPNYRIWAVQPDGSGLRPLKIESDNRAAYHTWSPDGQLRSGEFLFEFPNGLLGQSVGGRQESTIFSDNASWSRDGRLIAETPTASAGWLRVFSEDKSVDHVVTDTDREPYIVSWQTGSRWLDDTRLIFRAQGRVFLWDVDSKTARPVAGIEEGNEFVFSRDGKTLFMLDRRSTREIWLLELSK